ncbi:hypothetical protein [Anaerococcus degeneri]|uniref:Uncharacterized protein n=1 Tax=Anaerococcus degeneri TaxID=361500 RepID=A0ABS7YWZ2_9FIRM|nr:hypothetical protein [Anaerococcus degeneri]MBP2015350.1 hypothetical protein [Anaerococcus degeneri]MCA2096246.1 hypothetical protein [Anaerococcus degeneri]
MKKNIRTFTMYKGNVTRLNKKVKSKNKDKEKKTDNTSNPALLYLQDFNKSYFIKKPVRDVYDDYEQWCEDNVENCNLNMIKNAIEELWQLTVKSACINGKATRCFIEI